MEKIMYALKDNAKEDKITVVQVRTLEWFHKSCGNSYFAGTVELYAGTRLVKRFLLPFQYGYGNHSEYVAIKALGFGDMFSFREFSEENNIYYSYDKTEVRRERDLKELEKQFIPFPPEVLDR